ncbi:MAG TPA: hypothetical protein VD997_01040 [Phycisphaerales bacterium]|nr:hypothetical protein [Phycisphaerales bacterium]
MAGEGRKKLRPLCDTVELAITSSPAGSLRDFIRPTAHPDAERLAEYLSRAPWLEVIPGVTRDALVAESPASLEMHTLTDGVWAWRIDLAHYVRTHRVWPPDEFIEHARAAGWRPPAEEEIDFSTFRLE